MVESLNALVHLRGKKLDFIFNGDREQSNNITNLISADSLFNKSYYASDDFDVTLIARAIKKGKNTSSSPTVHADERSCDLICQLKSRANIFPSSSVPWTVV